MSKLRKQRRKRFRHNMNRKRLRKRLENVGKISCKEVEQAWDKHKSVQSNLNEMGLSYDPNKTIKILKTKPKLSAWKETSLEVKPTKCHVVEALEVDVKTPRVKIFRLPKGQVEWISYLMDKYGQDYKAMVKDRKNYNQETWKQLRAKVKRFKSVPKQFSVYLQERNLSEQDLVCEEENALSDDEV